MEKFFIYGKHSSVEALLNHKRVIYKVLATSNAYKYIEETLKKRTDYKNIDVKIVDENHIAKLLPLNSNSQGIALEVAPLLHSNFNDLLQKVENKEKSLIVILDGSQDPFNIGSVMRTSLAFGVDALILPKKNSPSENSAIAKTSSGAIEKLPLIEVTNIKNTIDELKKYGFWIIGLDGTAKTLIEDTPTYDKTALIFGNEENGLRDLTIKNCDLMAKININKNMESLNLSNSVAISLYIKSKNIL